MKIFRSFGSLAIQLLAIISLVLIIAFGYFMFFVDTETIGVNNVSDQIGIDIVKGEDLSEDEKDEFEERWFMQANYYSNDKNNGIELQELNFNYFTSHRLLSEDYRATGMQYVGDFETYARKDTNVENLVADDFYYYDTTDGISWKGYSGQRTQSVATLLNRDNEFIIKIDNRPFTIKLDGKYETGWWIFKDTIYYDYGDLFEVVFDAIESNSAGYGDYYITLDLSYFFSIKEMNDNGQFIEDDVTDIIKNYAVLKFHYDDNGAVYSNQSLFGKIENNSKYDKESVEFWAGMMVYNLTEKDLNLRYVEGEGGYYLSLSYDTKVLLSELSRYELNIDINLNSLNPPFKNYVFLGVDYDGFSNLNINQLSIIGNSTSFKILDGAFYNTTLKTLKYSKGIIFVGDFGINFERVIV